MRVSSRKLLRSAWAVVGTAAALVACGPGGSRDSCVGSFSGTFAGTLSGPVSATLTFEDEVALTFRTSATANRHVEGTAGSTGAFALRSDVGFGDVDRFNANGSFNYDDCTLSGNWTLTTTVGAMVLQSGTFSLEKI